MNPVRNLANMEARVTRLANEYANLLVGPNGFGPRALNAEKRYNTALRSLKKMKKEVKRNNKNKVRTATAHAFVATHRVLGRNLANKAIPNFKKLTMAEIARIARGNFGMRRLFSLSLPDHTKRHVKEEGWEEGWTDCVEKKK